MMSEENDTVYICDFCHLPFTSHKDDDSGICWSCLIKQIEDLPEEGRE